MTTVHAVISKEAGERTGDYWDSCKVAPFPNKLVEDAEADNKLWSESTRYLSEKAYSI
jgi:hypothetical protein